jgi:predicted enzyme related to lactoylglutathione lyase
MRFWYLSHPNNAIMFALAIDQLDVYIERLNIHDIDLLFGPFDLDFGRLAGILDPDGNTVQLIEQSK